MSLCLLVLLCSIGVAVMLIFSIAHLLRVLMVAQACLVSLELLEFKASEERVDHLEDQDSRSAVLSARAIQCQGTQV